MASWCEAAKSNNTINIEENASMESNEFPAYEVKNNTLEISITKRYFNNEFQHCFNYHDKNEISNEEIRISIQCKLGYYMRGISDDCENGTISIEDTTSCNYIEGDSENTLNFDLKVQSNVYERKVHSLNIMCIIETKDDREKWGKEANYHWMKYHFLQQFAIDMPFRITSIARTSPPHNSQTMSLSTLITMPYKKESDETSKNRTPTYLSVSVICILLLVFASGIYVRRWQKTKASRAKTSECNSKSSNTSSDDQFVNISFDNVGITIFCLLICE